MEQRDEVHRRRSAPDHGAGRVGGATPPPSPAAGSIAGTGGGSSEATGVVLPAPAPPSGSVVGHGVGHRRGRPTAPGDDELVAWLVELTLGPGPARRSSELAEWLMAAVPRRHWAAVGHLWCSINGIAHCRACVITLSGPLTLDQARHVLRAVRRRARGVVRDDLTARRRREIPVGDLPEAAVA